MSRVKLVGAALVCFLLLCVTDYRDTRLAMFALMLLFFGLAVAVKDAPRL